MYTYNCKLDRVIDGDTVDAKIDLGFGISVYRRIRLFGINAPETRTKNKAEKKKGLKSKQFLINALVNEDFVINTIKDSTGKYGRLLGVIYINGVNINDAMVETGYAKRYE